MVSAEVVELEVSSLTTSPILDAPTRRVIDRDNALTLFPRFAA